MLKVRGDVLNSFKSNSFPIMYDTTSRESFTGETSSQQKGIGLKILILKQMFPRLPMTLAQVKAGNNSENLLNEITQNVYSLHQAKCNY